MDASRFFTMMFSSAPGEELKILANNLSASPMKKKSEPIDRDNSVDIVGEETVRRVGCVASDDTNAKLFCIHIAAE